MPTYKHPCPHCGEFILRDVAVCPFCGARDPFAPRRCASCRTPLDDPSWVACPRCGAPTGLTAASGAAPTAAAPAPASASAPEPPASASAPAAPKLPAPAARACPGCGAALGEGARFCTVCGTLAG